MKIALRRFLAPACAAGVLLAAAACGDRTATEPGAAPPAEPSRTELRCTVRMADQRVSCASPTAASGPAFDLALGGQGTYVRLASSNVVYAGGTFAFDVTLQNLLDVPMGTADGTTAAGSQVVVYQGPVTTRGSGSVTVENPDGVDTFTAPDQPYFAYPEMLQPLGVTAPRRWRMSVPAGVDEFVFAVFVQTKLPAERGVLRWTQEQGAFGTLREADYRAVWGASPRDVFIVGRQGAIVHFDGTQQRPMASGVFASLYAVWGSSRANVYAAGDSGTVLHYDGNAWRRTYGGAVPNRYLTGIWGHGDTVFVSGTDNPAGQPSRALVLRSTDGGAAWSETSLPGPAGGRSLGGIWGTPSGELLAAGTQRDTTSGLDAGLLLRSTDGGATWSATLLAAPTSRVLRAVWADGPNVLVAGGQYNTGRANYDGYLARSSDGGATWTETLVPGASGDRTLVGLWALSPSDAYAVGAGGLVAHFDGSQWADQTISTQILWGIWASSPTDLYLVGDYETLGRSAGAGWSLVTRPGTLSNQYVSLWGTGAGSLYAVRRSYDEVAGSWGSTVARSTGTGWVDLLPRGAVELKQVWGTSASDLWTVGFRYTGGGTYVGVARHYDGAGWAERTLGTCPDTRFNAIARDAGGTLWIAGSCIDYVSDVVALFSSADGGATWTPHLLPLPGYTPQLYAMSASPDGSLHAVGIAFDRSHGTPRPLLLRRVGGALSVAVDSAAGDLRAVVVPAPGIVYAGGTDAASGGALIMRSADAGATWTRTVFPRTARSGQRDVSAMWAASPQAIYAAGTGGSILQYDGAAWRATGSDPLVSLKGLWGSSATDVYAGGLAGVLLHGTR